MTVATQAELAEQMVIQLRLLKPSISAEVGTPERLIIDTVALAESESQVDLIGLQQALNVDSKYGANLTNFLNIFGFNRQQATAATGYVIFTRNTPANYNILIPAGTILKASVILSEGAAEFATTSAVTLPAGSLETSLVPIKCVTSGAIGNVPANSITILGSAALGPVLGITSVTNPLALTNGQDQEDDNSLKVRFQNTVFRNVSGTEDQFLALAVATKFSTKAVAIGPVSRFKEYVQVPEKPDSEPVEGYPGTPTRFTVNGSIEEGSSTFYLIQKVAGIEANEAITIYDNEGEVISSTVHEYKPLTGEIVIGTGKRSLTKSPRTVTDGWAIIGERQTGSYSTEWTTALSENPYIKSVYPELAVFVSNTNSGISKYFFREEVDFDFRFPAKLQGDTLRALLAQQGLNPETNVEAETQPNVSFLNVYRGSEPEAITALAPESIVLLEYAYTSTSSRNNVEHNVTNCVDVFIDGVNEQATSTVFAVPLTATAQSFIDEPANKYYYENYRRAGEPTTRPQEGNIATPLFQQPVLSIPEQFLIEGNRYYLGTHYWLIKDTGPYAGTTRARDGIEWSHTVGGDLGGPNEGEPTTENEEPEYTGKIFSELVATAEAFPDSPALVTVENYSYDANIADLQTAYEGNRQITTDTLAHKARKRFFKLAVTIVYAANITQTSVNNAIREAVQNFLTNQYFGTIVRLSDLLQVIHNVQGVENVRWTNDKFDNTVAVYETNEGGELLRGLTSERLEWGNTSTDEEQAIYIVGQPTSGKFSLFVNAESVEAEIATVTARQLEEMLYEAWKGSVLINVIEDNRIVNASVTSPIRSFRVKFGATGKRSLPTVLYSEEEPINGGEYVYTTDFFLRDDELPSLAEETVEGDTVPGLIIHARAQNVWQKAHA